MTDADTAVICAAIVFGAVLGFFLARYFGVVQ